MKCFNHKDRDAIGTCTSCGKFICDGCSVSMNSKIICKDCINQNSRDNSNKDSKNIGKLILKTIGWIIAGYSILSIGYLIISAILYS